MLCADRTGNIAARVAHPQIRSFYAKMHNLAQRVIKTRGKKAQQCRRKTSSSRERKRHRRAKHRRCENRDLKIQMRVVDWEPITRHRQRVARREMGRRATQGRMGIQRVPKVNGKQRKQRLLQPHPIRLAARRTRLMGNHRQPVERRKTTAHLLVNDKTEKLGGIAVAEGGHV